MTKYFFSLIMVVVLFADCSKKDSPNAYLTEQFPQRVILVIDNENDPAFYDYLTAASAVVRRAKVEKKDESVEALYNSSHAPECVWIAHLQGNAIYFQLESDTSRYLKSVANGVNNTEYMLWASAGKGNSSEYLFDRHSIKRENGVNITTMESIFYPDHYFSHEGVVTEGNAVKLNTSSNAESAVKVRWYTRIY